MRVVLGVLGAGWKLVDFGVVGVLRDGGLDICFWYLLECWAVGVSFVIFGFYVLSWWCLDC